MGTVLPRGGSRIPAVERNAAERARAILEEADARAESIVRAAEVAADAIVARAKSEAAREALARSVAIDAEVRAYFDARNEDLIALALRIGTHLARDAVRADPSQLKRLVDDAVARLPSASESTVRMHPDDAATLDDRRVVPDATLESGDVVVESRIGRIDARFSTRLAAIREALASSGSRG